MKRYSIHPLTPPPRVGPMIPDLNVVIAELCVHSSQQAELAVLVPFHKSALEEVFSKPRFDEKHLTAVVEKDLNRKGFTLVAAP